MPLLANTKFRQWHATGMHSSIHTGGSFLDRGSLASSDKMNTQRHAMLQERDIGCTCAQISVEGKLSEGFALME